MKLILYPDNIYDLTVDLTVIRKYDSLAELMFKWATKRGDNTINNHKYQVAFRLNDIEDLESEVSHLFNAITFTNKIELKDKARLSFLINSLIYFCFEVEKDLFGAFLNDGDFIQLYNVATKIQKLTSPKNIGVLKINGVEIVDKTIAEETINNVTAGLLSKFIRMATNTKYRDLTSVHEVVSFANSFKATNETKHLAILGNWAEVIQCFLHNEGFILTEKVEHLNRHAKDAIMLSTQQGNLIYGLFELFNFTTTRKRDGYNNHVYIRNCINKAKSFDWSK